jgi:hypothetical protein
MPWHTVEQGEWIGSIAKDYGFYDWHTIYNAPENADLRNSRPEPHLLYPGDQVFVPDLHPGQCSCATDQLHTFVLKKPDTTKIVIIVKDENDQPIALKPYTQPLELTVDGNASSRVYSGTTDANGKLEREIPHETVQGLLVVEGYHYDLQVGHLDPIEEITGVQKRLTNIGYDCTPIDGTLNDQTVLAITQFQQEMNLTATGQLDDTTKQKLKEKYGC